MASLRRRLDDALILERPGDKNSGFLPYSKLQELLNEKEVLEVLTWIKPKRKRKLRNPVSDLTAFICSEAGALRTFAALIWEEIVGSIDDFYENNVTDAMLPFGADPDYAVHSFSTDPTRPSDLTSVFGNDTYWTDSKIDAFCSTQWRLLAPVFHEERFDYSFRDQVRMPFIPMSKDDQYTRETHFSRVKKRLIHRAHLRVGQEAVRSNVKRCLRLKFLFSDFTSAFLAQFSRASFGSRQGVARIEHGCQ